MTSTAKLFMHGRSQAVLLPEEFRFEGTEVRVSRIGDKVMLEPMNKPSVDIEKMGLSAGGELTIVDVAERTLIVEKEDRRKAALERLASLNWTLPPDYKFDRDEANER
jgi:antitoxin MazE